MDTKQNDATIFSRAILRLVKLLNVILMTLPFASCWYLYYGNLIRSPFYNRGNILIVFIYVILYFNLAHLYDGFLVSHNPVSEMVYSQMLGALISDGIVYLVIVLLAKKFLSLWPGIACIAVQLILSFVWCFAATKIYFTMFKPKRTAIIYGIREGMDKLIKDYGLDKKFKIESILNADECLSDINCLEGIETVFLSGVQSHDRNVILKYCVENSITVYVIPRVGDIIMSGAKRMHMLHLPMLRVGRYNPNPEYLLVKRFLDILISGIAAIILSPIMIITAIAIKSYDGGPVFYKQVRLTKDGKEFKVLKFRSMKVNAEKDGVARLSSGENDPRITPVGRIIRACRVDELPQLLNILGGSMSIVGPRPERPQIASEYEKELPEFRLRLQAKAGLTGYAQVYGKYNTTPYDKLQMDLMYISNPSILEDLKIMFATVKILFMPESTEGVAEGQTNAMGKK